MPIVQIRIKFATNASGQGKRSFAPHAHNGDALRTGEEMVRTSIEGMEMGFLIKSAFWLSLVLLVIPFGGADSDGQPAVGPVDTFFAARAVVDDMANLCERRPDACEVGRAAMHTIGVRAREGARIAYGMLDEHFGENAEPPLHTGSVPSPAEPVEVETP
jgi:hypothetical protein